MNPHAIETLGYLSAAVLNTSAIPQLIKSYKTKSAKDFSWVFFGTLGSGFLLNITYGILIGHPAIYCGSSLSMLLYGSLACMKYQYERHEPILPISTPGMITEKDDVPLRTVSLSAPADLRTKI